MHALKLSLLSLSILVAAGACGDKDKKKTTTASVPVVDDGTASGLKDDTSAAVTAMAAAAHLEKTVYFGFDSSELDEAARANLEENASWMKEDMSRVLTIEGHTDESGTTDYNLALGERRARITKEYLVRLGVDGQRVQIITYGEEKPSSSDDVKNRRSVFVATKK